jgi:hypothetical protein
VLGLELEPHAQAQVELGLDGADRPVELLVEPRVEADGRGAVDLLPVRTERRLREEPRASAGVVAAEAAAKESETTLARRRFRGFHGRLAKPQGPYQRAPPRISAPLALP